MIQVKKRGKGAKLEHLHIMIIKDTLSRVIATTGATTTTRITRDYL